MWRDVLFRVLMDIFFLDFDFDLHVICRVAVTVV